MLLRMTAASPSFAASFSFHCARACAPSSASSWSTCQVARGGAAPSLGGGGGAAGRRAYHANVLDHYENPRNVGALDKTSSSVGTGVVGAPACGDVMKLQIRVGADGRIAEAKFKTFGCGSAIASSSVATEWVLGKTLNEAAGIKNTDIAGHLKLPPVKLHCSMLAEDAIKAAVKDFQAKQPPVKA